MTQSRLTRQVAFLEELEKLKCVERRNVVIDRSRRENSAEHSFHVACMVALLSEHAPGTIDVARAIKMALVHDVVEIDAGDTFAHDLAAHEDKEERERTAAERIFSLLPSNQEHELRGLWEELERGNSPEAKLVRALDRLQPVLLHDLTEGATWREHGICRSQVLARVAEIEHHVPSLWPLLVHRIDRAVALGHLRPE